MKGQDEDKFTQRGGLITSRIGGRKKDAMGWTEETHHTAGNRTEGRKPELGKPFEKRK